MRPMSLFAAALVLASAVACRDTPLEPQLQPSGGTFASVVGFCRTSAGVTQHVEDGKIVVTGTDGWEAVNCSVATLPVIIEGLGGDDWLVGSPFDDVVRGGDGCDRVAGGQGNDIVDGGPGNDDGPENDGSPDGCMVLGSAEAGLPGGCCVVHPTFASAAVFGGIGDDLVIGGPGNDGLQGSEGFDICEPGPGHNTWNTCEVVRLDAGDNTPPIIMSRINGTLGNNDWYTSAVSVEFAPMDGESVITSTTGCGTQNFSDDTPSGSATCSATSAGGTASETVTFRIDQTVPTVSFAGNAGTYDLTDNVAITCSAADATSGVASTTCANVSAMAYAFGAGLHSHSASATDNAGNVGSGSTSFTVLVTSDGLCSLVQHFASNRGVANSLCAKLRNAEAAKGRGHLGAHANMLNAFRNEVSAQSGKAIAAPDAASLLSFVSLL